MACLLTEEYHYDKQTLLSEHESLLARTQNNSVDSSIQTIELQTSKLSELNNLQAIQISDLTPGVRFENKLIYSTQITPLAVAEVICFIIEDEYDNVCRVSVPGNVDTAQLVRGVKLAFSNPIYKMAFDGRYSLIVYNVSNISLLHTSPIVHSECELTLMKQNRDPYEYPSVKSQNVDSNTERTDCLREKAEGSHPSFENNDSRIFVNNSQAQQRKNKKQKQKQKKNTPAVAAPTTPPAVTPGDSSSMSQIGNKLFKEGRYLQAIVQYSNAIQVDKNNAIFYSNRAQCYSKFGEFENALTDFQQASTLDPYSFKYQYLIALTWSRLGNHKLSVDLLNKIKTKNKNDFRSVQELLEEEKKLLMNVNGKFDFFEMRESLITCGHNEMTADYIGPIQILDSAIHGRGIFTTRRVSGGENLCVVKAVEFLNSSPLICGCIENQVNELYYNKQQQILHPKLLESARKSKLTTVRLIALCDKSIKNVNIELFSSCGYEFAKNFDTSDYPLDKLLALARENLRAALIGLHILHNIKIFHFPPDCSKAPLSTGIWLLPSFMNHSCMPNAIRLYIGDICIVRAITDIPVGEEILISYLPLSLFPSVGDRSHFLGFRCDCKLCQFERKPDVQGIIAEILKCEEYLRTCVETHSGICPKLCSGISQITISREQWLDTKKNLLKLATQLRLHQPFDFFSVSFQTSMVFLIMKSHSDDDSFELLQNAEPFFSCFDELTYSLFWSVFCAIMHFKGEDLRYTLLFRRVQQRANDLEFIFT